MYSRHLIGIVVGIILLTTIGTITQPAEASRKKGFSCCPGELDAPAVVTGENVYIAWWTNNTANQNNEAMFRASTDNGATFGDKINLSNTTDTDSWRVLIAGEGDNVIVSWWETNQTSNTPVARISTDAGQTFGPMLMLATNGTIGEAAEGTEEGE